MSGICFAQSDTLSQKQKTLFVNGYDLNKVDAEYIEIVCYNNIYYGKKWAVTFDIGDKYINWKGHQYKDENGNVVDFESPMNALNYMIKCDWKFISRASNGADNQVYLYYLIYKKKD